MENLKGFQKKYPFIAVKGLALNTAKTVNRVMTEVKAGRVTVDVFDTSDDGAYTLAQQGALQKPLAPYPHLSDCEPRLQPSSGLFVATFVNPRAQGTYNTDLVPPEEVPRSWEEMASPKWKGKVLLSSSLEDIPARLAYLWRKDGELNWERSFDFFRKLRAQEPLITKGFRRGSEQLSMGEKSIFWMAPPGFAVLLAFEGAPIGIIAFPKFLGGFRTLGITKRAPNPNAAWLSIDYITSPEGQFEYTGTISIHLPLNPNAKPGKFTQWAMEYGCRLENSEVAASDYTIDGMAAVVYRAEFQKKSAVSHNWWKFDLAISYTLLPSQSTRLSNQYFL